MIRIAVIGTGFMGRHHAHAVRDHPSLALETVVDIDEKRATDVAERYGASRALTDYETALNGVDAAIVATPESAHAEQALAVLDRDLPLLLEKPIAATVAEAAAVVERAKEIDATAGVSFVLRYDPAYAAVHEAAVTGELGDLVSLRAKRGITAAESRRIGTRGHPLYYMNVHDIDAIRWTVGENGAVRRVMGVQRRGELDEIDVPDATQALLEFSNGTIASVEGYGILPADVPGGIEASFEVVGTDGTASVETPGNAVTIHGDGYDRPDTRHWPVVHGRMDGAVRRQIDWFANAIKGKGEMLATLEDGYRAQVVAKAIRTAIEEGKSIPVGWDDA
ncbi:Gfo/Idh/MocA family protein [Halegenticoccus tardaugens]|uniref:Gfo/Idh/MocA family protein n=1 Tax=Halegenticoccus tardaugens TaxID=2071624 RepID=UPI00100B3565|nr:Gfo/Idh/MocA family oxidoreductase [Halegenticoccus tardaugens]